ncbi:MAG: alternate-type signal peptide domain-containing protein [Salinibacterium sp.]|nr:alternate-type signal peptide domain-containing protein [Salinibacterium sp.]MBF0671206.1 alternate-type signal peptide domain-containing protein [Salinibacterium sp.]
MNRKTTGVIASAAGATLLLGSGTFALWSDSAEVSSGTITSGSLDLDVSEPTWSDVSADRIDSPHAIAEMADFRIIPGDTLEARYPLSMELEGENMLGSLGLAIGGVGVMSGPLSPGLKSVTYTMLDNSDAVVGTPNMANLDVLFASSDNGAPGTVTVLAGQEYTVVVALTFDPATDDQDLVQTAASLLDDSDLQLSQVRSGVGYSALP